MSGTTVSQTRRGAGPPPKNIRWEEKIPSVIPRVRDAKRAARDDMIIVHPTRVVYYHLKKKSGTVYPANGIP